MGFDKFRKKTETYVPHNTSHKEMKITVGGYQKPINKKYKNK